ncbi:MAG TPA: hypothetical protein PL105_01865 [Caldilineaceae bacterium]|nr:hypothetical protein [Caldilineaceae bacterium]
MPYYLSRFDDTPLPQRMTTDPVGPGSAPDGIVETLAGALDVFGNALRRPQRRMIPHQGIFVGADGDAWVESTGNPVVESAGNPVVTQSALSHLRGQYQQLARLWGRRGQLVRVRDDDAAEQWIWARLQTISADQDVNAAGSRLLEVASSFEVQGGQWRAASATISIYNGGEPVDDAILTITATTSLTGLDVVLGDAHLSFSGTVTAGTSLVIDAGALTVLNSGSDAYSNFVVESDHLLEGWLRIEEGSQSLQVTTASGTGTVSLTWYEQYV